MKGKFIMVDGLDGSGKGVVVDAIAEWCAESGKRILDLRKYCIEKNTLPMPEELPNYDVVLSAEPSFCYVGKAIREELVRADGRKYSAMTLAQAFALDREMLYKRVLLPALQLGLNVFQERGLVSSLVYQPVQEHIQLSELLRMSGNKLAIDNAPNLLLITTVSAATVVKRLGMREKKDNSIFDTLSFQAKIEERYKSDWLKRLFEHSNTKVVYLDTDEPKTVEETKAAALDIVKTFLGTQ
jgi:thymidylate kinase